VAKHLLTGKYFLTVQRLVRVNMRRVGVVVGARKKKGTGGPSYGLPEVKLGTHPSLSKVDKTIYDAYYADSLVSWLYLKVDVAPFSALHCPAPFSSCVFLAKRS
jgi:hypothetical protein